jgi:elongation factor Ts
MRFKERTMSISAKDVKKLRDLTGAGMMDCKKALVETDGDVDAAVEYLQVKGMAKAKKKAGRTAAQGLVSVWTNADATAAALVEVNSETDFVARNEQFISFVDTVTTALGEAGVENIEAAESVKIDGKDLETVVQEQIATIGENIKVRRVHRFEANDGFVGTYIHHGSQVGVLVAVSGEKNDTTEEFARDIAMHVAAMKPAYLTPEDVSEEAAEKQAGIFHAQLIEEGKPEKIIPRIMEGKMKKWRNESSLLEQAFVKDTDLTVRQHQDQVGDVKLTGFVRFEVGEGIEKDEANLADEVAAALKG